MKQLYLALIGSSILASLTLIAGHTSWKLAVAHPAPTPPQLLVVDRAEPSEGQKQPRLPIQRPEVFYNAILDRPLFNANRRPVIQQAKSEENTSRPVVPASSRPQELPAGLSVNGVLSGGPSPTALVGTDSSGPVWISEGEEIEGWVLTKISAYEVKFSNGAREVNVELFK